MMCFSRNILAFTFLCLAGNISAYGHGAEPAGISDPQFSENKGQWQQNVLYRIRLNTGFIYFEKDKLTFLLTQPKTEEEHHHHAHDKSDTLRNLHAFNVHFEGSNPAVTSSGAQSYKHRENYFIGKDAARWASGVQVYRSIKYHELYPGIDLQYAGNEGDLEYSFFIAQHADVSKIQMRFEGVDSIFLKNGVLHYTTSVNSIREEKLFAYQTINGEKREVPCRFVLNGNTVSFQFPNGYNPNHELVIDPTLIFSTYTGSSGDNFGFTATYDNAGNLYAGGTIDGPGYPTTVGAFDRIHNSDWDISISKFDSSGANLIYSTYLGGLESENPSSIVVNDQNELIVLGETSSADFPTSASGFDRSFNFGVFADYPSNAQHFASGTDLFVTKFNAAGSALVGSTYIGGSNNDGLNDDQTFDHPLYYNYGDQFRGEVVVDAAGNIYGVSSTMSTNFPVTPGAFQGTSRGGQEAVVFKFNPTLSSLTWSSYLGGSNSDAGYNLLVADDGSVYVSGGTASSNFPATAGSVNPSYLGGEADGYIAHISANGGSLLQATFVGTNRYDQTYFIDNDGSGKIYTIGLTEGSIPVSANVYSNANSGQFIIALTPTLSAVTLSTTFGRGDGDPDISPTAFLVDNCRNIYVSGWAGQSLINLINNTPPSTSVFGLPITANAIQSSPHNGEEFYFMVLTRDAATLAYATYFGSPSASDHVDGGTSRFDKNGIVYQAVCAGCGSVSNFPTTPGVWSRTNQSNNCNEGLIKYQFELIGVNVSISASPSTTGCVPLTLTFNGNGLNAKEYLWDFDDGTTSTLVSPTHTFSDTGTYIVTLIGIDSTTCDNLVFADTSRIPIIVRDDTVSAEFTPVIISNCDSFIVQFNNSSINAASYLWTFGDGITSTDTSPRHEYLTPGTYAVRLIATNPGSCNGDDTLTTVITLQPIIEAGIVVPDSFGCIPFTVDFQNSSIGGVQYIWSFGEGTLSTLENPSYTYNDTGTYTVQLIIIDSASCNIADTASTIVRASDNRVTTAFAMDTLAFECDSIVIQFTNQSVNYTSLLWDFGDGSTSTLPNPLHTFSGLDSFNIRLFADNPVSCNETDTTAQILLHPDTVTALLDGNDGCTPLDLLLTNNSVNATSYIWNFWNGSTSTAEEPSLFSGLTPGNYSVTLTAYNPLTCNDSSVATAAFTVYATPGAYFTIGDSLYLLHENAVFDNQSDAGSYLWEFGDGNTSTDGGDTVLHPYHEEGIFLPCLTVTTPEGCDSTFCGRLRVEFIGVVDVPNAFSPNGDGFNDIFYVRGAGVTELEFRIYNRWGELVFETNDIAIVCNDLANCIETKGWNGTYKNEKQEMDVYVYTLRAIFENGKDTGTRTGNISLIR